MDGKQKSYFIFQVISCEFFVFIMEPLAAWKIRI